MSIANDDVATYVEELLELDHYTVVFDAQVEVERDGYLHVGAYVVLSRDFGHVEAVSPVRAAALAMARDYDALYSVFTPLGSFDEAMDDFIADMMEDEYEEGDEIEAPWEEYEVTFEPEEPLYVASEKKLKH